MEILKFDLNEFLRYGCSGGVFLMASALILFGVDGVYNFVPADGQISLLFGSAVVIGIAIYPFHRGLLYPKIMLIHHARILSGNHKCFLGLYEVTHMEKQLNVTRWKRQGKECGCQKALNRWGSQSHFLYVVSISLFASLAFSALYSRVTITSFYSFEAIMVGCFAVLFGVAGYVNDFRCVAMEKHVHDMEKCCVD